jgi:hypothetical protein
MAAPPAANGVFIDIFMTQPIPSPERAQPPAAPGSFSPAAAPPADPVFPPSFLTDLVEPLFATPERARLVSSLIGAPLALAAYRALGPTARTAGIDESALRQHAQIEAVQSREPRERSLQFIAALDAAGIPSVAIKGLATAFALYPRPYFRLTPDVDLLVRAEHVAALARLLEQWGFVTVRDSSAVRAWGALTVASFAPIAPPEAGYFLDVHRLIDDPPAARGIPTEAVFARARTIDVQGVALRVPGPEDSFVILALNAFRDLYEARGLKSLFDAALLLRAPLDWGAIERMAEQGRFIRRVVFYRELLSALGVAALESPFTEHKLGPLAQRLLDRISQNMRSLASPRLPDGLKLALELALYDSPLHTARRNAHRLVGLVMRPSHALPGLPCRELADI